MWYLSLCFAFVLDMILNALYWYTSKCSLLHWYIPKYFLFHWYAPKYSLLYYYEWINRNIKYNSIFNVMICILILNSLYIVLCPFVDYTSNEMIFMILVTNKMTYMILVFILCILKLRSYNLSSICHRYLSHLLDFVAHLVVI